MLFIAGRAPYKLQGSTPIMGGGKSGWWSPRQLTHFKCGLVGSFTSPGIDTRQKGPTAYPIRLYYSCLIGRKHWQSDKWGKRNCQSFLHPWSSSSATVQGSVSLLHYRTLIHCKIVRHSLGQSCSEIVPSSTKFSKTLYYRPYNNSLSIYHLLNRTMPTVYSWLIIRVQALQFVWSWNIIHKV